MSQDIFNHTQRFGDAFSVDEATLTFDVGDGDTSGLGTLVQTVGIQYARPVQRIYELGAQRRTYYVVGRAEGNFSIQRLAAPQLIGGGFLEKFGNECDVETNNMAINVSDPSACSSNTPGQNMTLRYCLINSIALQMSVQNIALAENLSGMFASLSLNDS